VQLIKAIHVILVVLLTGGITFGQEFKAGSEPDGFRGIKWGTDFKALAGMKFSKTAEPGGCLPGSLWDFDRGVMAKKVVLDVYVKERDTLEMEGAKLETIEYAFWKGKFVEVTMTTLGSDNFDVLRRAVIRKYGEGLSPGEAWPEDSEKIYWYNWFGNVGEMELIYAPSSLAGRFWIGSAIVRKQIFEEAVR
jgi:hypothetical protein